MGRITKAILLLFVFITLAAIPVQAAPQASLTVQVEINEGQKFWNCTFFSRDADPVKPAAVKFDWSVGNLGSKPKVETLIAAGKSSGKTSIVTEKGELVNLQVTVRGPKNEYLGSWSIQTRNNGQTETITIFTPEVVLPELTRSNM
jgi:hypothetical protein